MLEKGENRTKQMLAWLKLCTLAFIVVGIPLFLAVFYRDYIFDANWLQSLPIRLSHGRNRIIAVLILITAQAVQVIISFIPAGPFQIAASYLYSLGPALLISLVGCVIGSAIAFELARILGLEAMQVIWGTDKFEKYHSKLNESKALVLVFLFYLIPAIPKDMISYVAGLTGMTLRDFVIVSTVARIPGMIGNLLIGTFMATKNYIGVGITVTVIAAIAITAIIHNERIMKLTEHPFFKRKED